MAFPSSGPKKWLEGQVGGPARLQVTPVGFAFDNLDSLRGQLAAAHKLESAGNRLKALADHQF